MWIATFLNEQHISSVATPVGLDPIFSTTRGLTDPAENLRSVRSAATGRESGNLNATAKGDNMKLAFLLRMCVVLWVFGIAAFVCATTAMAEPDWWTRQKRECNLPSSLAYNSWDGRCNSSSSYDDGAAQRAREAAEAAAAAERQRQ